MKKLPRQSCIVCAKECKRATTKTCSIECYRTTRKGKRQGGPKLNVNPRQCRICGSIFAPIGYKDKAKYCSRHCMGKARADFCAELGKKMRGKSLSKETRRKLSVAASKRNANSQYTKGRGGTRKDLGHYVRSRWEANVARYFKLLYGSYKYEPETFSLETTNKFYCYTPDFKVGDTYYEVKGYWDRKSVLKRKLFSQQYSDLKIKYIGPTEYNMIKSNYSHLIKEWEH